MMKRKIVLLNFIVLFLFINLNKNLLAQKSQAYMSDMGITEEMFSDVDMRDAKAVFEIWSKIIFEHSLRVEKTNINIYKNMDNLIRDINNNNVDLVFMNSLQYLKIKEHVNITPYYSTTINKEKYIEFLLLVNKDFNFNTFADLKGKSITIFGGRQKELIDMWLDVLLSKNGYKSKNDFFSKINYEERVSKNILDVFFGKKDICVTLSSSFETLCELNGQVKNNMKILYREDGFVNDLYCISDNFDPKFKEDIFKAAKQIDSYPKTEQVYKIFKIDGTYYLGKSDLYKTTELWLEHKKLK